MKESVDQATRAARAATPVLVEGPPGSGRGHIARAIHEWSPRAAGTLVVLSAAALPSDDQARELFGASDSGRPLADGGRTGALARAAEGTLLIEQIDQLAANAREALLRTLRDQSFTLVGDGSALPLRARIVGTTTADGAAPFADAGFERVRMAALADRVEDVLPLAAHFLAEFSAEDGSEPIGFTQDARRWLVEETWLGNVRELSERIRQAVRLAGDGAISAEALMLAAEGDEVPSFKEAKRAFETRYVEGLLRRCNGNISRAARLAKKDRKDFYDVIRRTGVDPSDFRP